MKTPGEVTIDVVIPAPVDQVWAELERIEDHVEWMADAVSIDFHSAQRRGVGTSFSCRTKIGPFGTTDEMVIDQWVEGHAIGVTHRGAVTGSGAFTLEEVSSSSTKVTWNEKLEFPWYFGGRIGATAARPIFRWIWGRNLRELRARVTSE